MAEQTSEDEFFRELSSTCTKLRQAFAQHVNMTAHQVQILVRLRRDGETSHSNLGRTLGIDGASITRLIKRFESEGLVCRRLDPADNRYTLSALTPAGEQLAARLERSHQTYQEWLLDGVTMQDREIVLRVLQRVRENAAEQEKR